MDINQLSQQAGFKRTIGNTASGFVLLTDKTNGQAGRKIFINAGLAPKFKAMVEESKENYVLHQLSQLRAIAGTGSSYTNIGNPKEHKTKCGDLDVTYTIYQHNEKDKRPGVYITDIDFGLFGKGNTPGTYRVKQEDKSWRIIDKQTDGITTQNAAINGLSSNLISAGQKIMPPMVEYAYGQSGDSRTRFQSEGYTLFYNPQSIKLEGKEWKTPEQKKTNHKVIANTLARELEKAQTKGKKVQWTIHGNGAQVFKSALEQLPGKDLSVHELMFMAPEGRLDEILPLAKNAKMSLHTEVMKYSDYELSRSRLSNQFLRSDKVANEIGKFGSSYSARAAEIAGEGRNTVLGKAFNAGGAAVNLTILSGLKSLNPIEWVKRAHLMRNSIASMGKLNNADVNPHHSPHLSQTAFNNHVKTNAGGMLNSYGVTFKSLLKRL